MSTLTCYCPVADVNFSASSPGLLHPSGDDANLKRTLQITVQTVPSRRFFSVEVEPTDTVAILKNNISRSQSFPSAMQVLTFRGERLCDSRTVSSCRLTSGCVVHLSLPLRASGRVASDDSVPPCTANLKRRSALVTDSRPRHASKRPNTDEGPHAVAIDASSSRSPALPPWMQRPVSEVIPPLDSDVVDAV